LVEERISFVSTIAERCCGRSGAGSRTRIMSAVRGPRTAIRYRLAALGEMKFTETYEEGKKLSLEEAVASTISEA
jgi:hypothetical protein